MSGRRYGDALIDADSFPVDGLSIQFASKESLIEWKEASVREKDRMDGAALRLLQRNPAAFD